MVASPRKRPNSTASSNGRGSKKAPVEIVSEDEKVAIVKEDEEEEEEDNDDEEAEEYEIEAIRDHREDRSNPGYLEYLIKWKGYPEKDNTWEPEENAKNSQTIIDAYWKKKPTKSQPKKFQKELTKKPKCGSTSRGTDEDDEGSVDFQDADEELAAPASKKRKSSTAAKRDPSSEADLEELSDDEKDRQIKAVMDELLSKYKKLDSWDALVDSVETMERGHDNILMARLAFKKDKAYSKKMRELGVPEMAESGPQLWVKEIVASKKCPQRVLHFYREHLRFSRPSKPEPEEAMDEA